MASSEHESSDATETSVAEEEAEALRLVLDPSIRATGIQVSPVLNTSGRTFVRLLVKGPEGARLMESSQDLEDTLALGSFIVEAVGDVLKDVAEVLKDDIWREQLGTDFEGYLVRNEAAVAKIRALIDPGEEVPDE